MQLDLHSLWRLLKAFLENDGELLVTFLLAPQSGGLVNGRDEVGKRIGKEEMGGDAGC